MAQHEFVLAVTHDHRVSSARRAQHTADRCRTGPRSRVEGGLRDLVDDGGIVYDGAVSGLIDGVAQTRSSRVGIFRFPGSPI